MTMSSENILRPVIEGAEQYKFYRAPAGLKEIRSKQKVAIVFGYVGENYYGLQWNKLANMPTVESVLLKALYETDMISLTNFSNIKVQQLLNFERASRTDKGVHALCNVISVSLMLPYSTEYVSRHVEQNLEQQQEPKLQTIQSESNNDCKYNNVRLNQELDERYLVSKEESEELQRSLLEQLQEEKEEQNECKEDDGNNKIPMYSCELAKELLNKALPDDIYVYKVTPVTRSFNSYMNCNNREYEYYIPTFAFMNKEEYTTQYFTRDVAPERPTLTEIGFVSKNTDNTSNDTKGKENEQINAFNSNNTSNSVVCKNNNSGSRGEQRESIQNNKASTEVKEEVSKQKEQLLHESWEQLQKGELPISDELQHHQKYYEEEEYADFKKRRNHGHFPKRKSARKRLRQQQQEEKEELSTNDCKAHEHRNGMHEANINAETSKDDTMESRKIDDMSNNNNDSNYDDCKSESSSNNNKIKQTSEFIMFYSDNLFEPMMLFRTVMESVMRKAAAYRISAHQLTHIRELFKTYEGTHCFHNFTPGGFSSDPSCHRFIRQVTVSEPFVIHPSDKMLQSAMNNWAECNDVVSHTETENDNNTTEDNDAIHTRNKRAVEHIQNVYGESGLEVVCVKFSGQSFMLNQIRKMIGAVMCMAAADLNSDFLKLALLKKGLRCSVPMAPANGLFLSHLDFGGYNKRLRRIQDDGNNGANKLAICMDAIDNQELTNMREKIVSVVLRNEMANDLIGRWMRSLRQVIRLVWKVDLP